MVEKYKEIYPSIPFTELEPHFSEHMLALNVAMLEDRAEIATQLAWRDKQIESLTARLEAVTQVASSALGVLPVNVHGARMVKEEIERILAEDDGR